MFLKYSLIGLGNAGIVGVGGYAVYHEVSKNKLNKDVQSQYGADATVSSNGNVTVPPTVDASVQNKTQPLTISPK